MPINRESHEKLLRYVHRIAPIDTNNPSLSVYSADESAGVFLNWQQRPNDLRSEIVIMFTDSKTADVQVISNWKIRPRIILSSLEVGKDKVTYKRNPLDSVRALLTILAVITELSNKYGSFTHVVRANEHSRPLFDLLVNLGIYYLSDEVGKRVVMPKKWDDDYTLYACKYPVVGMPDLSAYAPNEFVAVLSKIYVEYAMKLKDPRSQKIARIFEGSQSVKQLEYV